MTNPDRLVIELGKNQHLLNSSILRRLCPDSRVPSRLAAVKVRIPIELAERDLKDGIPVLHDKLGRGKVTAIQPLPGGKFIATVAFSRTEPI